MCAARGDYCQPPTCNPAAVACYESYGYCREWNADHSTCLAPEWQSGEAPWSDVSYDAMRQCLAEFGGCVADGCTRFTCAQPTVDGGPRPSQCE